MPEPLKNVYNPSFFEQFIKTVKQVLPALEKQAFLNQVFDADWEAKELKQRMRHISTVLHAHLPGTYQDQLQLIICIIEQTKRNEIQAGFQYLFFPDFIEQFGQNHVDASLNAMETVTQFTSCEFAIRPFLLNSPGKVMKQMLLWSRHPHPHVRRFATEGCRPRLPWAMAIPSLKKDPSPILPILQNLKSDASLFVRKSVANNLNDIAKDHPEVVVRIVQQWKGISKETDWIIRHGCRTLLKQAHSSAYALFGLKDNSRCEIADLTLSNSRLKIGNRLRFSFQLKTGQKPSRLRLEYAIYYAKANGKQSRKIFQLAEKEMDQNAVYHFKKEQRFQDFTTRKHYPGEHRIAIVVNGQELATKEFMLTT